MIRRDFLCWFLKGGVVAKLGSSGSGRRSASSILTSHGGRLDSLERRTQTGGPSVLRPKANVGAASLLRQTFRSDQTITTGTDTDLEWSNTTFSNAILDLTNTALPIVKVSGVYVLSVYFQCSKTSSTQASWGIEFDHSGDDIPESYTSFDLSAAESGHSFNHSMSLTFYLAAGSTVYMYFHHNKGSNLNITVFPTFQQIA